MHNNRSDIYTERVSLEISDTWEDIFNLISDVGIKFSQLSTDEIQVALTGSSLTSQQGGKI